MNENVHIISDELYRKIKNYMEWSIPQLQFEYDQQRSNFGNETEGGYSPELTEAREAYDELRGKV